MKKTVNTEKAPKPVGPYNQAVISGGFVFTAGQVAIDPRTNQVVNGDVREQTRLVLQNLREVLHASGSHISRVVKTTVYLKDMNDFPAMNEIYAEFFTAKAPARSAVEVSRLPKDVLVEIDCIAETEE